jgi:hypothetical protein
MFMRVRTGVRVEAPRRGDAKEEFRIQKQNPEFEEL